MSDLPGPLLTFALRHSLISLDDLIAQVKAGPPWIAANLARDVAPVLADDDLLAFREAVRGHQAATRAVREVLARRGHVADALGDGTDLPPYLFDETWPKLQERDRGPWSSAAAASLEALVHDSKTTTLTLLGAAKSSLCFLSEHRQKEVLARLCAGYEEESAAGQYEELETPYGTVDPTLELARTFASVGDHVKAAAYVEQRHARYPQFFNAEELWDCSRIVDALPEELRPPFETRFEGWAAASRDQEDPDVYALRWLTRRGRTADESTLSQVRAIVAGATAAEAVAELAGNADAGSSLRAVAVARLVALAQGYAHTLATLPKTDRSRGDWQAHAFSVRQFRSTAWAVSEDLVVLDATQHEAFAAAARVWSGWLATESTNDWNPLGYTAIHLAKRFLADIPEAVAHIDAAVRAKQLSIVTYSGWELLFPPERAMEIARQAL